MKTIRDITDYIVDYAIAKLAWSGMSDVEYNMYKISFEYIHGGAY